LGGSTANTASTPTTSFSGAKPTGGRPAPESKSTLLPVTVALSMVTDQLSAPNRSADTGCLTIAFGQTRIRIEGRPDTETRSR
jgi:hypothetical protein